MAFYVIQTIMGLLGSVGFAVLFGVYDRKLFRIAAGSAAGVGGLSGMCCQRLQFVYGFVCVKPFYYNT